MRTRCATCRTRRWPAWPPPRPDGAGFCAVGREAARRALGERPYDAQLLGTLVMLSGQVAEMATGEGKTLSGALAAAAYAAGGRSVHVMSVNDYLARRDADWMRPLYDLLGVTVGCVGQASSAAERRRAYAAQVTYAPVSEIGFDVLRDRFLTDAAAGDGARARRGPDRRGRLGPDRRGAGAARAGRLGRGGRRRPDDGGDRAVAAPRAALRGRLRTPATSSSPRRGPARPSAPSAGSTSTAAISSTP